MTASADSFGSFALHGITAARVNPTMIAVCRAVCLNLVIFIDSQPCFEWGFGSGHTLLHITNLELDGAVNLCFCRQR